MITFIWIYQMTDLLPISAVSRRDSGWKHSEQLLESIVRLRMRLLSAHLSRMKEKERAAPFASLPALERLVVQLQGVECTEATS
jgi:hypothetical protein